MGTPSMSKLSALKIGSTVMEYISSGLREVGERSEDEGLRDTRGRHDSRITQAATGVAGPIVFEPTYVELQALVPYVTGTSSTALTEDLTSATIIINEAAATWSYANCYCGSMSFQSSEKSRFRVNSNWIGKTRSSGTLTSPTYDNGSIFMHHQLTVDLGGTVDASGNYTSGTTYDCLSCNVTIDNMLQAMFRNSITATSITPTDRNVGLQLVLPYTSDEASIYTSIDDGTSIAGSVTWNNGTNSITFVFPSLIAQPETPTVPGGAQEITMPLNFRAYTTKISSTIVKETIVTLA